jgi:PAS domain S-box-containing protein/diguanylate cyclase (GGDEF)-like protein
MVRLAGYGLFLLAYYASMALGLLLTRFDRGIAVVWIASAVLFVQLVLAPRRRRAGFLLGAVPCSALAIAWYGLGPQVALPLALIGVIEAWAAAALIKRVCPRFGHLQSVDEVLRFLVVAGLIVPALGACAAAGFVRHATGMPLDRAWREWFAAHALGYIVFSPPLLLALRGEFGKWARSASAAKLREAALLLVAVAIACLITFGQSVVPLVLFPLIAMVAATIRLGRFGAMASVILLMIIGLVGTSAGYGPTTLLHVSVWLKFEVLQGYFACVVMILLPLAAELVTRQRLLDRLRAAETLHRLIIERSSDVIVRQKRDGTISFASPSVVRLWGYLPEELVGRSAFEIIHPRDAPQVRAGRHSIIEAGDAAAAIEYRTLCKDGRVLWVEGSTRAVCDHTGHVTGTLTIIRDITTRRALFDDPGRQAQSDPLTGLAHRGVLDRELARALGAGQAGCLALFDLDRAAAVADRSGMIGDAPIAAFAAILRESVRGGDIPVRLGSDAFAILLFGASLPDATQICERIIARFAANHDNRPPAALAPVTVSAGLVRFAPGTSPEAVMTAADTARYNARNQGRNRLAVAA